MRVLLIAFLLVSVKFVSGQPGTGTPSRNDHMFPAALRAKPFIDYDTKGFLINGKRTFIASAGMEYARVPRALWHDRLLRLKRAGFNAIEMYTFWNFHEPKEGQFNFSGDHDLNAFLKMIKAMNMYAIVRVGPYYCGEWNLGGYPIWLKVDQKMRVREDNPQFLTAVDKFFDKLIPIVSANQINHGGPVIMVQLENEHRAGWGDIIPNNYFKHLKDKTVSLGLEVPYFFSGLHSGNDPAGDFISLDDPERPNPWFSAEYWGVWYLHYGPQDQDSTLYDRRTWKIIAHGGNGYNVYMAHGGTNFDYNNDRDMAASYDYGASVGQAGDLRPIYYSFKRANWFAQSFGDILENSTDADNNMPTVSDTIIKVTARKSPAGTIAFIDNPDSISMAFKLKAPESLNIKTPIQIKLAAGEIMPVVQDHPLTSAVKLLWAPTRIYNITSQGNTTTILVYGAANEMAQLYFNVAASIKIVKGSSAFYTSPGILSFTGNISPSEPSEYVFETGSHRFRILVVNNAQASHTWFADANGQTNIVIGPAYAADLIGQNNKLNLTTEQAWLDRGKYPVWIFKPAGAVVKLNPKVRSAQHLTRLKLRAWEIKNASMPALPAYNDETWKVTRDPLQMGADGDITADAWYRTKINFTLTADYILQFKKINDRAALFLDGRRIDTGAIFSTTQKLHLTGGIDHTLALFTAHDGRNKLIFKLGAIDTLDAKGLSGALTLREANVLGEAVTINNWRMKGGPGDPFAANGWKAASFKAPGTRDYNSPQFYRATFYFPVLKQSHAIWRVNTTSLSYGSVWINGHNLGRYPEKVRINGLYIPECWLKPGNNTLIIYDENGVLPGKVSIEAEEAASRDIQTLQF